jgi:hypothetical protein
MSIHRALCRAPMLASLLLPAMTHADSALVASAHGVPATVSAHLMVRIVIPQTLAFSVVQQSGAQGPALNLQVQLNNNDELRLAPASLTRIPLVRCNSAIAGQTVCTAATP